MLQASVRDLGAGEVEALQCRQTFDMQKVCVGDRSQHQVEFDGSSILVFDKASTKLLKGSDRCLGLCTRLFLGLLALSTWLLFRLVILSTPHNSDQQQTDE